MIGQYNCDNIVHNYNTVRMLDPPILYCCTKKIGDKENQVILRTLVAEVKSYFSDVATADINSL